MIKYPSYLFFRDQDGLNGLKIKLKMTQQRDQDNKAYVT